MTFSGRTIREFSTGAGTIAETRHESSVIPPHAHPQMTFCLVTGGDLRESAGGSTSQHHASDLIFRAAGEPHANVFGPRGAGCFNVVLEPSVIAGSMASVMPVAALPIVQRLRRELRSDTSSLIVEGLLLQLAGEMLRVPRARATVAIDVSRIIRKRFPQPLTISSIAAEIGVHPVHAMRAFRQRYGRSIAEAVRDLRIGHAMALLQGSQPLADIAVASGFADQSHFTRMFRRATGTTPNRYRLALRG
jgi:AraC family transcriptional regulator